MVGVKGRSGGRRYTKPDAEKKTINKTVTFSPETMTMIQQLAIAKFGTDQYTFVKCIEDSIRKDYQQTILSQVPAKTTQGTYAEFRREFLNIYRPDINNPKISRDYYVSDELIKCLRKYSTDKKHQGVIVRQFVNTFEADLENIHDYFLSKKLFYDLPLIAAYGLRYFAEPADAV